MPIRPTRVYVILTSSRDASLRTRSLMNFFSKIIPYSLKYNRGKTPSDSLLEGAKIVGAKYLVYFGTKEGNPTSMRVFEILSGLTLYSAVIKGLTLPSDSGVKIPDRLRPSVGRIECKFLGELLLNLGVLNQPHSESEKVEVLRENNECILVYRFMQKEVFKVRLVGTQSSD